MLDASGNYKKHEESDNWLFRAAREVYNHPGDHVAEIAGTAAVVGGVLFAHKISTKLLGQEVEAAKDAAMTRLAPRFLERNAPEVSSSMLDKMERAGRKQGTDPVIRNLGQASEYVLKGLEQPQTYGHQVKALKDLAKPVDYEKMLGKDTQVAIFAESHPIDEVRSELGRQIPELKRMGFTHLALEALPASRQGMIENYYAGKVSDDALLAAVKTDWGWSPHTYKYLIETAKQNGMKVLATDLREESTSATSRLVNGTVSVRDLRREAQWVQIIGDTLKEQPDARIASLAGMKHTVFDPSTERYTTLLGQKNIRHKVIEYSTGWQNEDARETFDEVVSLAKMHKQRFMVAVEPTPTRPADYFVHLPSFWD